LIALQAIIFNKSDDNVRSSDIYTNQKTYALDNPLI